MTPWLLVNINQRLKAPALPFEVHTAQYSMYSEVNVTRPPQRPQLFANRYQFKTAKSIRLCRTGNLFWVCRLPYFIFVFQVCNIKYT
jgi:hypothetical protein